MAGAAERIKEYEIAFVAKLLDSESVKRGIDELEKGMQSTKLKAKGFFESIKKFIPDLGIFNKLLSLAGVSGVLSFGALISMMPQASRAFARAKQDMRRLAQFLGPVLEPAFEAVSGAISTFITKLIEAETKYGIFGKIAKAIAWVFAELVRVEKKYDVIDKLFGLAGATFDFTIKVLKFIDDVLPDWAKTMLELGIIAITLNFLLGGLPFIGVSGLLTALGLGGLGFKIVAGAAIITLYYIWKKAGELKENLQDFRDTTSYDTVDKMEGGLGVAGRAAWKFEDWTRNASWQDRAFSLSPVGMAAHGAKFAGEEGARALGIKIIVDERGMFLGIEPDNGAKSITMAGGGT